MSEPDERGVRERLALLREESGYHWPALVAACVVGLVAASLHWVGLVVGGALVGLVAASLGWAILAGVGFGLLVLAAWAALLGLAGTFGAAISLGQITYVSVAIALGLPALGSLVRGVV